MAICLESDCHIIEFCVPVCVYALLRGSTSVCVCVCMI